MQLIGAALRSRRSPSSDERLTRRVRDVGRYRRRCGRSAEGRATRVDLFVLLPKGRVSEVQRRFMTASGAANVHAIEIDGDFDDCQAIVKTMFADKDFAGARRSRASTRSTGRASSRSRSTSTSPRNALAAPGPVNFVVPTGNFGDAFSGYVAKQMGAPIGKILHGDKRQRHPRAHHRDRALRARGEIQRHALARDGHPGREQFRTHHVRSAGPRRRQRPRASTINSRNRAASTFPRRRSSSCASI